MLCLTIASLMAFWFSLRNPLFIKPTSFVLEDENGELLNASIASDGQWRFPVSDSVPLKFEKCITAFEDKRFNNHPGVDLLSMTRAIFQNLRAGKVVSGGSTLTMQVIRLAYSPKRSFLNKVLECIRALRLELGSSKKKILALYSSNAPFGSNVVGLHAASWRYFGRSPDKLSWGEMASLAVLPNAPSLVHPGKNRSLLLKKRNRLLETLMRRGILTASEARLAAMEPVPQKPLRLPQLAPHLLNLVKKHFKEGKLHTTRIRTSINSTLQRQIAAILDMHHDRLSANGVDNMAALVLDIKTGKALVYIGNIYHPNDPEMESHVDIIQARRSPGSTLKPILYAAMLNEGMLLPNSLVPDIPTQIAGYQPNNYDLGYDGAVPASKALARSLNVPAVKMLQQYKYARFHDLLKNEGINTLSQAPDFYGLSLILGGCEVNMWELAGIYASMARTLSKGSSHGAWHAPVYSTQERSVEKACSSSSLPDPASIWYTFEAMNEVMRPGEEQLWQQFSSSEKIAWKTGTSFGFRDAWAIGLNTRYVVAVWAGNADGEGRPGLTGIDAAAPALFDIFRQLPASGSEWFRMPQKGMVSLDVCAESGFRASDWCTHKQKSYVPEAGLKSVVCPYNRLVHLDKSGRWQVTDHCAEPASMIHRPWFVLPPAMEYYYRTKNYSYKPLPPFLPGCASGADPVSVPMELIYPKNNARIYVPLELDGTRGQVIFNAAHRRPGEVIHWHLDNHYIGSTEGPHQQALNPSPGRHHISLVDEDGNRIEQTFTILDKKEK